MSRNSPSWEAMCDDQKNGCETNQQTLVKLRWFLFLYILPQLIKAVRSCWKQQHPHSESVKSYKISEKHLSEYKKLKAHTSQRPKRLELIRVSLIWRMPRGIATPPCPPGQDANLSQGCLPAVCRRYPFIDPGKRHRAEWSSKGTTRRTGLWNLEF